MRILHVYRQTYGGIATHVRHLEALLQELGHRTASIFGEEKIPEIPGFFSDRVFVANLNAFAQDFDLVHAHGYMPAWLCSCLRRKPWVYTAHSTLKKASPKLIERLNKARAGICVSAFLDERLSNLGAKHLTVNPGGVLFPTGELLDKSFAKRRFGIRPEQPCLAALGRLVAEKGFDRLVEAMDEVWRDHPQAVLLLSGDGPERARLSKLVSSSAQPDKIKLLGRWPTATEVYGAADLFVMPSVSEALGLAALEAMSVGVPVLASHVEGLASLFEDGVSGKYVYPFDNLARVISDLLAAPTVLQALAAAGRVRAEERFDFRKNIKGVLAVYQAAIA